MIEHVFRGTVASALLDEVVIATCDQAIAEAAATFGARAVMTSPAHERATDRVAEAVAGESADVVVMVQGDEPMVQPGMVATAVAALGQASWDGCVNLAAPIASSEEANDPHTVKVVMSVDQRALYFTRSPVPSRFDPGVSFKQVCVMAFARRALERFRALPQGPLERLESIDMLRFLEHGLPVRLAVTDVRTHAVDTPDDLRLVSRLMGFRP